MIKCVLDNEILGRLLAIERAKERFAGVRFPPSVAGKLRKSSKKMSSYASNKIEGNPLNEAQADAAAYLAAAAARVPGPLIVGGHSKGGNLAVYASAMASPEIQDRILHIYNNDGPGFLPEFYREPGYLRIRPRLHTLLPQNTLVGTLLTREKWASVVKSTRWGPAAHDGFTWEVRDTAFVRCPNLSPSSRAFEETMDRVLANMGAEQRREFTEELFDALAATGAGTVTEVSEQNLYQALETAGSFRKGTGTKRFVLEVIREMIRAYTLEKLGRE